MAHTDKNVPNKKENPKKVPESNDRVGYGDRVKKSDEQPEKPLNHEDEPKVREVKNWLVNPIAKIL